MSNWSLYLVRTRQGSLYTGITTDVERRLGEHQAGWPKGAKSLRGRGPLTLAFSVPVGNRAQASRLEWLVKQWSRQKKEDLVSGRIILPGEA
ncbi:GIY-YIG nuclease family protein [Marinobacter changyiensis]|uniref:GIY-YIG nuclease family protein n=1 Tax=Marinobacter changyiensis TaxID=2604091 RepID=UPI00126568CB|nr:GIY-YIG nuclease family protein [Marinobacter changyiensis]